MKSFVAIDFETSNQHRTSVCSIRIVIVEKGIAERISYLPLVAHNSQFDKGCLIAIHELYEMPYPDYQFYCTYRTYRIAKKVSPDLINHQLHTVSEHIGYELLLPVIKTVTE